MAEVAGAVAECRANKHALHPCRDTDPIPLSPDRHCQSDGKACKTGCVRRSRVRMPVRAAIFSIDEGVLRPPGGCATRLRFGADASDAGSPVWWALVFLFLGSALV